MTSERHCRPKNWPPLQPELFPVPCFPSLDSADETDCFEKTSVCVPLVGLLYKIGCRHVTMIPEALFVDHQQMSPWSLWMYALFQNPVCTCGDDPADREAAG